MITSLFLFPNIFTFIHQSSKVLCNPPTPSLIPIHIISAITVNMSWWWIACFLSAVASNMHQWHAEARRNRPYSMTPHAHCELAVQRRLSSSAECPRVERVCCFCLNSLRVSVANLCPTLFKMTLQRCWCFFFFACCCWKMLAPNEICDLVLKKKMLTSKAKICFIFSAMQTDPTSFC